MIPGSFLNPPTGVLPFDMFRSFAPVFDGPLATWTPPCDIYESDSEIILKMELPEVKEENVHIALEKNVLKLHGERKREETVKCRRIERKYGEFARSFSLPALIEGSKILAEFKEGTLTVTLAKERRSVKRTENE
jgi:HSP20 family protein